jgi:quercetin dioxygenase-like cupin family protein
MSASWPEAWPAAGSPPMHASFSPIATAAWGAGPRPFYDYRDLGLAAASGGLIAARHIRVRADAPAERHTGFHCHELALQWFYVLSGSITLEPRGGEPVTLRQGDSGFQPPWAWHDEYDLSDDYAVLEVTVPSEVNTITEEDAALPQAAGAPAYQHARAEDWVTGAGARSYLAYRDFGMAEPSSRRLYVQGVRVVDAPEGGTGWHYHTMSQFFFLLEGVGEIAIEGLGTRALTPGDAMVIGAGPSQRHDVTSFSGDYTGIEVTLPADYETIEAQAPPGF